MLMCMFNLKRFNMKVLVRIFAVALAIFILQPNCAEAQNKQLDKAHKKERNTTRKDGKSMEVRILWMSHCWNIMKN